MGYDSKIHRDDRHHILKIGRSAHEEVSVNTCLYMHDLC
jgi:hypothetical protein